MIPTTSPLSLLFSVYYFIMENTNENPEAQRRGRSKERRSEGTSYVDVARTAVFKESDVKTQTEPAISMTVVGETVTFTQHFHF